MMRPTFCIIRALCLYLLIKGLSLAGTSVVDITFHPSEPIAVWNGDYSVIVHSMNDSSSERKIHIDPIKTGMFRIHGLTFHPSGKYLALAGGSPGTKGSVLVLNWPDGEVVANQLLEDEWMTCIAFSNQGSQLAVGAGNSDILIFDFTQAGNTLKQTQILQGHAGSVMDLLYDESDQWLVSGGSDRSVKIWNMEKGELHRTYSHHTGIVYSTALRPSQSNSAELPFYIATASTDQTVRIWQPEIGRMVRIVRNQQTELFAVAYHPSGNWMASAGKDGVIHFINANSDQILKSIRVHDDWIYALSFSPNGEWLASGDWKGKVQFQPVSADLSAEATDAKP